MKRLTTMLCLATLAMTAWAAEGVTLGYCNGQVVKTSDISVDGDTWVDAAIVLTADMLAPYTGGQLTTVRVGLAARTNIDIVRAWVRTTLDGDNLASADISAADGEILRGWNEIALGTPCTIAEGQPLYIGFSYKQAATSKALSVVSGSHEGAFYFRGGDDAQWEDRSSDGLLSLEAVVEADDMVGYDLRLLQADARIGATGGIELTATVHNNGSLPVSGYTLTATIDGTGETIDTHMAQALPNGASATHSLTLLPQTPGVGKEHMLTLAISSLDGDAQDERPDNNALRALFTYQRRVLIEEFTGEECTNCPRAAKYLHDALAVGDNASRTAMVAHHSGYTPDFLTFYPSDIDYEWFYNHDRAVFAPALMFDRVAHQLSYGTETYMAPVYDPASQAVIEAYIGYYKNQPSHAWLEMTADGGQTVTVGIRGGRSQAFGSTPTRLTVCLVEDHIEQREQVSMNTYPEFEHMGALRAINSTWGDEVEWTDDGHFTASMQFALDDEWKRENLRVVAFLSEYDAADPTRCQVENCEQLSLGQAEAISDAALHPSRAPLRQSLFTLDGKPLASPQKGISLLRQVYADGTTRTVKIFR